MIKKKIVCGILLLSMFSTMLYGCGKEEVVVEEDTHAKISVSQEELVPEITDEDLGIIRKDPNELWKITGYQAWNNYNFLIIDKMDGSSNITVAVDDKNFYNALYDARLSILLDLSYASVDPTDQMYAAYASGLRSLGNAFYDEIRDRAISKIAQSKDAETVEEAEEAEDETVAEDANPEEADENTEDAEEISEDADVASAEDAALLEALDDVQSAEDFKDNGAQKQASVVSAEEDRAALKAAIEEYMQTVSLNKLTGCVVYALDGEQLGDLSAAKINDYVASLEVELVPYELTGSSMYVSDLFPGVTYEVAGAETGSGQFELVLKNDVAKPLVIYAKSEHQDIEIPMFLNYGSTEKSLGWENPEQEWSTKGTDEMFTIKIEQFNNDADLIASLSDAQVLRVTDIHAKRVKYLDDTEAISSIYSAVLNDTSIPQTFVADTGDVIALEPFQAMGLHYAAYGSLRLEKSEEASDDLSW